MTKMIIDTCTDLRPRSKKKKKKQKKNGKREKEKEIIKLELGYTQLFFSFYFSCSSYLFYNEQALLI